jgi:hypothetical protein
MHPLRHILAAAALLMAIAATTPSSFSQVTGFPVLTVTDAATTNVSGVAYTKITGTLPYCYYLLSSNVVRNGTNLSVNLYAFKNLICLCDIGCPDIPVTQTLVLGALEPGDYRLAVYNPASPSGPLFDPRTLIGYVSVTVSNAPTPTPMLSLSRTNSSLMKLDVNGVVGANYIIQCSTDFTNWTSIWTNHGGPFWATFDGATNQTCYFRTQIFSGP